MHYGLGHVLGAHSLRIIEEVYSSMLCICRVFGQVVQALIWPIRLALVTLSVFHLLLWNGEYLGTSSVIVHSAVVLASILVLLDARHPRGVSAVVLFRIHHYSDLVVASVSLVVRLVVVAETLHH